MPRAAVRRGYVGTGYVQARVAASDPLAQRARRRMSGSGRTSSRRVPGASKYVPHAPTPKQREFLALDCREAMYGGAAAGGKSDALLMAALQYVHVPGYAALLLRRTYADLVKPKALISRAHEWLNGTDARWHEQTKTWHFPSGATLSFGYIDNDLDLQNYQGAEYQFVGFDELTQHKEKWYKYLFSRLRRLKGAKVPVRMRSASNPGGIGHVWVKSRFITDAKPVSSSGSALITAEGRVFVPAMLIDNPHVDAAEYELNLRELDPVLVAQLLQGDWNASAGGLLFKREWFKQIARQDLPAGVWSQAATRVRIWDLAATEPNPQNMDPDYTVGLLVAFFDKKFYVLDMIRIRKLPGDVQEAVKAAAQKDGRQARIRIEREPGASGKAEIHHYVSALRGFDVDEFRPTESKEVRARPASSQAKFGNIVLMEASWNSDFLDELEGFGPDCPHDDIVDTLSGAVNELTVAKSKKVVGL